MVDDVVGFSFSLGTDVQNALLQPVTIVKNQSKTLPFFPLSLSLSLLDLVFVDGFFYGRNGLR